MSISVSLLGGVVPPNVQIVVSETPVGERWTVTGSTGEYSWTLPGGVGVGDGNQLVLVDNRAPGNREVVYTFTSSTVVESSDPVVVPFDDDIVIQNLAASKSLTMPLLEGSLEMRYAPRQDRFTVSGRRRPIVRHDVTGDVEGTLNVLVTLQQMPEFKDLLASGEPLLYRFGTQVFDLDPVGVISYSTPESVAWATEELRIWSIPYVLVDDPYLDARLGGFAWDFFDGVFAGQSWDDFDAQLVGVSWDEFDVMDWAQL